ncbi:hypothetical protein CEQ11_000210 [Micrococcus sp. FDAARGOS_333]|nr:hypothetical protein CEQ11_000210 [Micrococcus sp. FDAARGOS_333]
MAFECISVQVVLDTLMVAVRPTEVLVVVSIWGMRADFDIHKLVMKEIDLRRTIAYVNSRPATIEMEETGKMDLAPLITDRIGLDGVVEEGFETLIHRNETAVKIPVSPSGKDV